MNLAEEKVKEHKTESPKKQKNYFYINSTENHNLNLEEDNHDLTKITSAKSKIDEHKLDESQTPVSTSYKSKSNIDRLTEVAEEYLLNNNNNSNKAEDLLKKLNKPAKNSRSDINEILTVKSTSYYNDVMNKEIEGFNELNLINRESNFAQHNSTKNDLASKQNAQSLSINKSNFTDGGSDLNKNEENLAAMSQNKEVVLNLNDEIVNYVDQDRAKEVRLLNEAKASDETNNKRLATFYNGKNVWTIVTDVK